MVTHYQGPRSRGWVASSHLCNVGAYIGSHARGTLTHLPVLLPLRMKVAVVSSPDPMLGGPLAQAPGGQLSLMEHGKGWQILSQLVPARPLPQG